MNGKLFLKRKRDEQQELSRSDSNKRERFEPDYERQQRPSVISEHRSTPPPSPPMPPANQHYDSEIVTNSRNQFLIEALQKIAELQKELDDFESDLDYNDEHDVPDEDDDNSEISFYLNEHNQQVDIQCQRHEAEALGFAMCARETLLFLQREGIPQDSAVYQTLREKLVGQVEESIPI